MKILVTGACGFKGNVLVPKLLAVGHHVLANQRNSRSVIFGLRGNNARPVQRVKVPRLELQHLPVNGLRQR